MIRLDPFDLVANVLAIEAAASGLLALLVVAFGVASRRRAARAERRMRTARALLGSALEFDEPVTAELELLARMPWATRLALVLESGQILEGEWRSRLGRIGSAIGVGGRGEGLCRSRFWWRRLLGARIMTALGHDSPVMRSLLRDSNSDVRAQALIWAADRTDGNVIEELVHHLVDSERLCRFTVQDSLLRLGRPAAAALARFLSVGRGAGLEDGLTVARGLAQAELLEPVLILCRHPDAPVRTRATSVLGVLGGERGVEMLLERLDDEAPAVRAAAAHATGEIGHWRAVPRLARLLADRAYPVRREAALALRRLGGVGVLTLRRARSHENLFAADISRQALDLPESAFNRVAV